MVVKIKENTLSITAILVLNNCSVSPFPVNHTRPSQLPAGSEIKTPCWLDSRSSNHAKNYLGIKWKQGLYPEGKVHAVSCKAYDSPFAEEITRCFHRSDCLNEHGWGLQLIRCKRLSEPWQSEELSAQPASQLCKMNIFSAAEACLNAAISHSHLSQ